MGEILKLGATREVKILDEDDDLVVALTYRLPKTDEWVTFQGEMADIVQGESKGTGLTSLCARYGEMILLGAEGPAIPDGLDRDEAVKVVREWMGPQLAELGQKVFMLGGGLKLDMGKSEARSERTSEDGSAE